MYRALRAKAARTNQSLSGLVNGAVRQMLGEDADDLTVSLARAGEPNLDFETVLRAVRSRGRR